MTIAVLVTLGLGFFLIAYAIVTVEIRRRAPRELRGDWWDRFERQFRAYASSHSTSPRHRRI